MNEEHLALRDAVRSLLAKVDDTDLWARLCGDIGVAAFGIPERFGGFGGLAEAHVVLAELGRSLSPVPMLGSLVATQALLASGDERLLPAIADGSTLPALVWTGADGRWDPSDVAVVATGTLNGTAHYVLDGGLADVLLVAARTADGVDLFEVDPAQDGVERSQVTTMDPNRHLAVVRLTGAVGRRLGPAKLAEVRDIACAALSAEQVGAAARALELTVAYTKTRVQFGRPIGSFQALKHRMADLHVLVETARSASGAASDDPVSAAVAKVYCAEAFTKVAGEMIQLHGGIAITWEHDAHLYFKRAHGSAHLFGSPTDHIRRLNPQRVRSGVSSRPAPADL